jgi:nucleotide-binding universal stress UspA family protein
MASSPHTHSSLVVIAYDGTPSGDFAIREAGALLEGRRALVVVVWKEGLGFELMKPPTTALDLGVPPVLDVRGALEIDRAQAEQAQTWAQHGAELARRAGFEAEGLAVAERLATPVADTIVAVANERNAQVIVVGAHTHGRLSDVLLGSTSGDVLRQAVCLVIVVREH